MKLLASKEKTGTKVIFLALLIKFLAKSGTFHFQNFLRKQSQKNIFENYIFSEKKLKNFIFPKKFGNKNAIKVNFKGSGTRKPLLALFQSQSGTEASEESGNLG